nr:nodal modulator 3 [Ipomoea batatas]
MAVTWHALLSVTLLLFLCASTRTTADVIQGCGGFVEASRALIKSRKPTDSKLDYSHISVELRTLDGLVKDRTQCAPNGYYFIPVYDKGSFIVKVKGPEGWSWDPEQVRVSVDHTGCNANEDVNFQFTGFTVSGRVVGAVGGESCTQKNEGPPNVKVELLSPTDDVVSSVLTTSSGTYSFTNVVPGKYKLRASRHDLNIQVRGSAEVELGFENGVVDDFFFVPGYDIRGSVVAQGNPILGVHIYLHSDDVSMVDCLEDLGNMPGDTSDGAALCHAVTDADGIFTFKSVPCGLYKLIPFYKGENTIFDVSPSSASVIVKHDHTTVPQKFQVTGFSVGGRVVDGNGEGVDGVKIIVDGQERSITDKEGYYKLDQVTSKRYNVEAKKEHYRFNRLNDFLVLPNMASIAEIKALSYDVCGNVQTVNSDYMAKVTLTHGPENMKPQVKKTDQSGNFCFEVPPGEYRLSAIAANPENAPDLLFFPPYVDVSVRNPLLGIVFNQVQVNIVGSVVCKEKCGSSVSLTLVRLDGKHKGERKIIYLTNESNKFLFSNVLPGKYRVEVKNNSPGMLSGEDRWCWDESFINVNVGTEDVKGLSFFQKGYWVNIISSHEVDAFLTQQDGSLVDLKIKKGSQRLCVESPGVHELNFRKSCISFGSSSLRIDTSDPSPISLKGEKYLLKGQIHVDPNSLGGSENLPQNIQVDILDTENSVVGGITASPVHSEFDQSATAVYEYSTWATPGDKFIFVPRDSRDDGGKKILFYPRQQHVSLMQDDCPPIISPFYGRIGLYIEGSVSPPLSDINIKIIAAGESGSAPLKHGDVVVETTTGADGLYVAGPLYDDINYSVEASKSGYHVKPLGPHSFSCQKLSQIFVRIYSKEDAREPFPSALLSLSGEDGYRNNSVTGVGGTFIFDNLFPGSFYLRPLLKEYAFSPPAQAIELGSGESREIVFHATRVAYSAMGVVALLSGQPKEGVSIEARADSEGFYEETVTDSSGNYRLRGLLPDTTYVIRVSRKVEYGSHHIERASPEYMTIKVGSEDHRGLDFVVFEEPEMTILSCHVEGQRVKELHSHIQVEVKSATDPLKIESVFPLPLSNFFQVKDLPKGKHLLQLRSAMPSGTHRFESEVIEVDLEKHSQIHVGPLRYKIEEDHQKQELTPVPVYPLIAGVSVIILFISMPRLKDLYQAIVVMLIERPRDSTKKKKLHVKSCKMC